MEVITIETQAFKDLMAKINKIAKFVAEHAKEGEQSANDGWVDSYEVCTFLKVSEKTLQRLRASKTIAYSRIRGKNYYRLSEIKRLMDNHIIRRSEEDFQNLIINHQLHVEQRRNIKTNK